MYWNCDVVSGKWYLFREDEENAIAEVGVEDGELESEKIYFWLDSETGCGYGDYATCDEAKAAAEAYVKSVIN